MESEVFQTTDTDMRFTKIADADANRVPAKLWSTENFQMVGSQLIFLTPENINQGIPRNLLFFAVLGFVL